MCANDVKQSQIWIIELKIKRQVVDGIRTDRSGVQEARRMHDQIARLQS